ncbi:MAG TPA: hypothetical protein VGR26_19020 [Acidimicrobiales bacterium]|nr:hypothetical protein [Acidimicrobiales bacterium]
MRKMVTAAVGIVLLVAGCGGSGEPAAGGEVPPPDTAAPTVPTSTTVDRAQLEQAVLDAYLASWEAWDAATNPPDPDFPALAETNTGPALQAAVDQITAWKASGRAAYDPPNSISEHRAEVVRVDGREATVRDCSIDDGLVVIAATGEVVNDQVETALFEASMVIEDERWKVQSLKVMDTWEGVAGCANE